MANTQIDVPVSPDITKITATDGGEVEGIVRVTIKEGANESDAQIALQSILSALTGGAIVLR